MPVLLSVFNDELSRDLAEACEIAKGAGLRRIALRIVRGANIQELPSSEVRKAKRTVQAAGLRVSCLGAAFGKTPVEAPFDRERDALRRALDHALFLDCRSVRVFSFYPRVASDPFASRGDCLDRLRWAAEIAREAGVVLLLENERRIYGDNGLRNFDLLTEIASENLRAAFDFANYVQCGVAPWRGAWLLVKEFVADFHLKDARAATGAVTRMGEGDGEAVRILRDAAAGGFSGALTLEPHLEEAGERTGFTGPRLFPGAVDAAKRALEEAGIAWP